MIDNTSSILSGAPDPSEIFKMENVAKDANLTVDMVQQQRDYAEKEQKKNKYLDSIIGANIKTKEFFDDEENFKKYYNKVNHVDTFTSIMSDAKKLAEYRSMGLFVDRPNLIDSAKKATAKAAHTTLSGYYRMADYLNRGIATFKAEDQIAKATHWQNEDQEAQMKTIENALSIIQSSEDVSRSYRSYIKAIEESSSKEGELLSWEQAKESGNKLEFIVEQAITQSANMGPIIGGTAIAGPVGGFAAGMGVLMPQVEKDLEDIEQRLGITIPEEDKAQWMLGIASVSAASELIPMSLLGSKNPLFKKMMEKGVLKSVATKLSKSAVARGVAYTGANILQEEGQEGGIEFSPTLYYDKSRALFDKEHRELLEEVGVVSLMFSGFGGAATSIAVNKRNSLENLNRKYNEFMEQRNLADKSVGFKQLLDTAVESVAGIRDGNPNITDLQMKYGLDSMSPDTKGEMVFIDNDVYNQLAEENPELAEKLDKIKEDGGLDENSQFGRNFNFHKLLSFLTPEEFKQIEDHAKASASDMSITEANAFVDEEIEQRLDLYLQEAKEVGDTKSKELNSLRNRFMSQKQRLMEQTSQAGFSDKEVLQHVGRMVNTIMSNRRHSPESAIKALKNISITREGMVEISGIADEGFDPVAIRKRVSESKVNIKTKLKEYRENIKKETKSRKAEADSKAKEFKAARKEDKKSKSLTKRLGFGKKDEAGPRKPKAGKSDDIESTTTVTEAIEILRPDIKEMKSIGVNKGAKTSTMSVQKFVETLFERGVIEENGTAAFVKAYEAEQQNLESEMDAQVSEEEAAVNKLVEDSKSVNSIAQAEALLDEVTSLPFIPEESIKEIEQNLNIALDEEIAEVDRMIKESEVQSEEYDQNGNLKTDTEQFKNWFGDSKVVDENGNPLVVSTGSSARFNEFSYAFAGQNGRQEGAGFYFTTDRDTAKGYATEEGQLVDAYLSMQKPMAYDQKPFDVDTMTQIIERAAELEAIDSEMDIDDVLANFGDAYSYAQAIQNEDTALDQLGGLIGGGMVDQFVNQAVNEVTGFDGVVSEGFSGMGKGGGTIYVVWFPNQIKSVKAKAFDPTSGNIFEQKINEDLPEGNIYQQIAKNNNPESEVSNDEKREDYNKELVEEAYDALGWTKRGIWNRFGKITASRISQDFRKNSTTRLIGQKINNYQDMAEAAQVYRNPVFESFRLFFIKDGVVVGQTGVSARLPGVAPVFPFESKGVDPLLTYKDMYDSLGADSYYMLHNHPSGNVKPSSADQNITDMFKLNMPGFNSHIIINHKNYAVMNEDVAYHSIDNKSLNDGKIPDYADIKINDPDALAYASKKMEIDKDKSVIMSIDSNLNISAIYEIDTKSIENEPVKVKAAVRNMLRASGGNRSVIVMSPEYKGDTKHILDAASDGVFIDGILPDGTPISSVQAVNQTEFQRNSDFGSWTATEVGDFIYEQPVYHGTPHSNIAKFSLDKIGTGEGAQAYGYGLYFTNEKDIAEHYREYLSDDIITIDGEVYDRQTMKFNVNENYAIHLILSHDGYKGAVDYINRRIDSLKQDVSIDKEELGRIVKQEENTLSILKQFKDNDIKNETGQTYKVDIPESKDLLQDDKNLSEQPKILEKLENLTPEQKALANNPIENAENMTGHVLYDNLEFSLQETMDKREAQREASIILSSIGIPGLEYQAGEISQTKTDARNFVIWNEEAIKILDDELYRQKQQKRQILGTFNALTGEISLGEKADKHTVIHELGHMWMEDLINVAKGGNGIAQEDQKAAQSNIDRIETWIQGDGSERFQELTALYPDDTKRIVHEMIAESFEVYMAEGKAPTEGMRGVFDKFKDWLAEIYSNIESLILTGEMPRLNDDVRQMFDDILTFENEITEATQQLAIPTGRLEGLNVTQKDIDTLTKLITKSYEAAAKNRTKYFNGLFKNLKKAIEKKAKQDYRNQEFMAIIFDVIGTDGSVGKGPISMSSAIRLGIYNKETAKVPGLFKTVPDNMTDTEKRMFDYGRDITEIVNDISTIKNPVNEDMVALWAADFKTEKTMVDEAIEPAREEASQMALERSVYSSQEMIDYQFKLSQILQGDQKPVSKEQIKAYASKAIKGMRLSEAMDYSKWIDNIEGLVRKRNQLTFKTSLSEEEMVEVFYLTEKINLNHAMAKASIKLKQDYEKTLKKVLKATKENKKHGSREVALDEKTGRVTVSERNAKRYKQDHFNMANLILSRLGAPGRKGKNFEVEGDIEDYVTEDIMGFELVEAGLNMAGKLSTKNGSGKSVQPNILNLNADTFQRYVGIINNILINGKHFNNPEAFIGDVKVTAEEAIVESAKPENLRKGEYTATSKYSWWYGAREKIESFLGDVGSSESLLRITSGLSPKEGNRGLAYYIMEPLNYAFTQYQNSVEKYSNRLKPFRSMLLKKSLELRSIRSSLIKDPLLRSGVKTRAGEPFFSSEEIAMIPIHIGTVEGRQKLIDGYGWTDEQLNNILDKYFTVEEMAMFQDAWNAMEELYKPANDLNYKIRGIRIGKKENLPFTFKGKEFKGGYAPGTVDMQLAAKANEKSVNVDLWKKLEIQQYSNNVMRHDKIPSSFKKVVPSHNLPLKLDYQIISKHFDDVVFFTNVQETMDYIKVITQGDVMGKIIKDKLGKSDYQALIDNFNEINQKSISTDQSGVNKIVDFFIRRFREAVFIGKFSVRAVQILGALPAMRQLGVRGSLYALPAIPKAYSTNKFIMERSGMMRQRKEALNHHVMSKISEMKTSSIMKLTASITKYKTNGLNDAQFAQDVAYVGIGAVDSITSNAVWMGEYRKTISDLSKDDTMTEKQVEEEAARRADELVRRTQDINRAIDVVTGQRATGMKKSIYLFASFAIRVNWQRHREQYRYLYDNKDSRKAWLDSMQFLVTENIMATVGSAMLAMIANGDAEDIGDDEFFEKMIIEAAKQSISPVPVIGSTLANPYFGQPGQFMTPIIRDWGKVVSKNTTPEERAMASARIVNALSGQAQVVQGISNINKQIEKWNK